MDNKPFGQLDTSEPAVIGQMEKMLDEKYNRQTKEKEPDKTKTVSA